MGYELDYPGECQLPKRDIHYIGPHVERPGV